jgi:hypothetical protein
MHGEVTLVNEYPEPSWSSSSPKEYLAFVEIVDPPPTLRTGLTAKAQIVVDRVDDALQVPVQAVYLHGTRYYCIVQRDGGGWTAVDVKIGPTNNEMVVIEDEPGEDGSGLHEGMQVSMTPEKYLDQVVLPELADEGQPPRGKPGDQPPNKPQGKRPDQPRSSPSDAGSGR